VTDNFCRKENNGEMSDQPKVRLLTLDSLDRRTAAAKNINDLIAAIEADQGGADDMSTARRSIAETTAVATAMIRDLAARWIKGEQVDLGLFATLSNAQRRAFETLGFDRVAKNVTPSVSEYLAQKTTTEK
jgi:hypothetical protein